MLSWYYGTQDSSKTQEIGHTKKFLIYCANWVSFKLVTSLVSRWLTVIVFLSSSGNLVCFDLRQYLGLKSSGKDRKIYNLDGMEQKEKRIFAVLELPPPHPRLLIHIGQSNYVPATQRQERLWEKEIEAATNAVSGVFFTILVHWDF